MPSSELNPLTPLEEMQRKFVRNVVRTGKIGQSALRSGYSHREYGSHLIKQPKIKRAIEEALERAKITDDRLAKNLSDGLDAKWPAKKAKDGTILQAGHPDHLNRRGYQDMIHRIRGDYAPEKLEVSEKLIVINLNIGTLNGLLDSGAITEAEKEEIINLPPEAVRQLTTGEDNEL